MDNHTHSKRPRKPLILLLLTLLLAGGIGWFCCTRPARLAPISRQRRAYYAIRWLRADGPVVKQPHRKESPSWFCRHDWHGRVVEKIIAEPASSSYTRDAWSPDRRMHALFFVHQQHATVITRRQELEIARVTFPLRLLSPPEQQDIYEQYVVAVDNAGRVMIACPNAPSVSLVAMQVLLTPDARYALCIENFAATAGEQLLDNTLSRLPSQRIRIQRPDGRLAIYERPGRLRAAGYCHYSIRPTPAMRMALCTAYDFSPDGKKVVENREGEGITVFAW